MSVIFKNGRKMSSAQNGMTPKLRTRYMSSAEIVGIVQLERVGNRGA
jgi:Na+(H+)/acetate symporter ActP